MGRTNRRDFLPKTHAKAEFALSDEDLATLCAIEKKNPFSAKAAPMKLYNRSEVRALAVHKFGSEAKLAEELEKRASKRRGKAIASGTMNSFLAPSPNLSSSAAANVSTNTTTAPASLHPLIAERMTVARAAIPSDSPCNAECVLYWMKTALRGHDNPALDVARSEAALRKLPLIVAAPVLLDYAYASARRVKFMLEGLQDVQRELRGQGLDLLVHFHGAQADEDWEALMSVASCAAVVITEAMPVPPETDWLARLCKDLPGHISILTVDCACTYPTTIVARLYERAYAYRSATSAGRAARLGRDGLYSDPPNLFCLRDNATPAPSPSIPKWINWTPIDLSQTDIEELVLASPRLDHSVPAVTHMRGGSAAGYKRWDEFRQSGGLRGYAMTRNNALNRDGVSRLSAYHRWGMVSPFKIARDALACPSGGARKFLDEFLIWRELSYAFCAYKAPSQLGTLDAVPKWAATTLAQHADDARNVLDEAIIEKGMTGDAFWDAAQQQLVATGELHNNVRMTWGKAFIAWTPSPSDALRLALYCNHKYALDGCDPASYGGVLWCFGQFDGPKGSSNTPILGSLRPRPTAAHARRLDPHVYRQLPP